MQALGLVWGNLDSVAANLEEVRTRIDVPSQYGARLLLDYWRARQAEDGFVVGATCRARRLACVLRNLAIYEPIEDGRDFRFRLAGTAFMRRFGRDVTGLKLSEIERRIGLSGPACQSGRGRVARANPSCSTCKWRATTVCSCASRPCAWRCCRRTGAGPGHWGGVFYSDWA